MRSSILLLYVAAVLGVIASLTVPATTLPTTPLPPGPVLAAPPEKPPVDSPPEPQPAPVTPQPAPVDPEPAVPTPAPVAPPPNPQPTPEPAPAPVPAPEPSGPYVSGGYYGSIASNKYQNLQVFVTIDGGYILDVSIAQNDASSTRSIQISGNATPQLRDQAVARQSAQLDTISGATYTSESYRTSLQAALDQARR